MARDGFGKQAVSQPLAGKNGRSVRDWTARTRSTALEAGRYSRFVAFMKRLLPIGAAVVLGAVLVYWVTPRHHEKLTITYQRAGKVKNDLAMTRPKLTGTDAKGNPFVITADAAVQDSSNRHRAELRQVQADMQYDNTRWMTATAKLGHIDVDAQTLKLDGGIAIFTDTGYELHTNSADVDLRTNQFQGTQPVSGHGPLGALSADRFAVDRVKQRVKLDGHVRMIMYPKKVKR